MSSPQDALDSRTRQILRFLGPEPTNWVIPVNGVDHDVVVIGGGQSGLSVSYALRRAGITHVSTLDAAPDGEAGVWKHRARMLTLRTPKNAPGPELGNPALSFQAWYEGLHGEEAFRALGRIRREDWPRYLQWYQSTLGLAVRHRTRLRLIEPAGNFLRLHLTDHGVDRIETTRKLVLATGMTGTGGPFVPGFIRDALPREFWAHTADPIDFASLRGRRVAVLGAATSAFDAAATAAEAGAEVHLFSRRPDIVGASGLGVRAFLGLQEHYDALPDADRWHYQYVARGKGAVSPFDSILRPARSPNFFLHFNARWHDLRLEAGRIALRDGEEDFEFDFLIVGTGYQYDPHTRPEFAAIAPEIALWRDRHTPPPNESSDALGAYPYVGPAFEFLEKHPGRAPYLKNIHVFNMGASLSFGRPVGDIPGLRFEVPKLVKAIGRDLLADDLASYRKFFDDTPDFDRSRYEHAIWSPERSAEAASA